MLANNSPPANGNQNKPLSEHNRKAKPQKDIALFFGVLLGRNTDRRANRRLAGERGIFSTRGITSGSWLQRPF